jgi:hypothetical protein
VVPTKVLMRRFCFSALNSKDLVGSESRTGNHRHNASHDSTASRHLNGIDHMTSKALPMKVSVDVNWLIGKVPRHRRLEVGQQRSPSVLRSKTLLPARKEPALITGNFTNSRGPCQKSELLEPGELATAFRDTLAIPGLQSVP